MFAFLGLPGGAEWIIILLIALLLFGKRLPSVMRSLAQSIVGFKHEMNKAREDLELEDQEEERKRVKAPSDEEAKRRQIAADDGSDAGGEGGPDGSV